MSASVADILRDAGFVPVVPELSRHDRDKESKAGSRVPAVPVVPVEKYKGAIGTAKLRTAHPANPANVANITPAPGQRFADSQDSQGADPASAEGAAHLPTFRAHLRDLANAGGRDPALIDRLPAADLPAYASMTDAQLIALLSMLADDADRERGKVPDGDTAAILCRSCGPVWVHPAIARALPVVGGWPRALGCPWCFIRARGVAIPRPHVTCADCRHRIPDTVNPAQGMGRCAIGNEAATWPGMRHRCGDFRSESTS